jgi:hypothetical protein
MPLDISIYHPKTDKNYSVEVAVAEALWEMVPFF